MKHWTPRTQFWWSSWSEGILYTSAKTYSFSQRIRKQWSKKLNKNCYWDKTPLQVLIQHMNKYCSSNNSSHRRLNISKSEQIISYRTNTNYVLIRSDYESQVFSRQKFIGIWFNGYCVWFIIWVFETTVRKLTAIDFDVKAYFKDFVVRKGGLNKACLHEQFSLVA